MTTPFTNLFPDGLNDYTSLGRVANNAVTVLTATLTAGATTATVTSTALFPQDGRFVIEGEVIYYAAKTSTTFTGLSRGQEGTIAIQHAANATVGNVITERDRSVLVDAILGLQEYVAAGGVTQPAHYVFAGPASGSAAQPTFRPLETSDMPAIDAGSIANGSVSNAEFQYLNGVTSAIQTQIDAKQGAFSVSAPQRLLGRVSSGSGSIEELTIGTAIDWIGSTRGSILYRSASGWAILAPGVGGSVLTSSGAGTDPTYQELIAGANVGLSNLASVSTNQALIPQTGLDLGAQATAWRNPFFYGAGSFGTTSFKLHGTPTTHRTITFQDADYTVAGLGIDQTFTGVNILVPVARTSGSAPYFNLRTPTDTALTASVECPGARFGGDASGVGVTRQYAAGALAVHRENLFLPPTLAFAGASTATTVATVAISAAPVAGANATLTTSLSLWCQAGMARFDGGISSPGATSGNLSEAFGRSASVGSATQACSVGYAASCTGSTSTALGASTSAAGNGLALGSTAISAGAAVAVGIGANAAASSVALGFGATTTGANQCVIGGATIPISQYYFGRGVTDATPAAFTINGTGGSGSNVAGGLARLAGGKGTGTGTPGAVALSTSVLGASGSTLQSLVDRFVVVGRKAVPTNAAALSLFEIALPTLTGASNVISYTVYASDGTDVQVRSGVVRVSAVNKAGAYTSESTIVNEAVSASAGTLTATWGILNGTNKVTIQVTPTTSLTATTYYVAYSINNNSEQAITIL